MFDLDMTGEDQKPKMHSSGVPRTTTKTAGATPRLLWPAWELVSCLPRPGCTYVLGDAGRDVHDKRCKREKIQLAGQVSDWLDAHVDGAVEALLTARV